MASGLNKTDAAGVFATGDAAGLLSTASTARASRRARGPKAKASASCSAISIYSGQQKVAGCFRPIEKLADIPAREKGAVRQLADSLRLDEEDTSQMQAATKLTDNYVSEGKALLNDKFPVTPERGASVLSMPQADTLFSAKAELPVGGATSTTPRTASTSSSTRPRPRSRWASCPTCRSCPAWRAWRSWATGT